MTFADYYKLPDGTNATLKYNSFFDTVDSDYPCPSDMSYVFAHQKKRTVCKKMNTSNVTDMRNFFYECNNLTHIEDISNWNTSKVTNMDSMFSYCQKLTSLDISNWDTSNVTDMGNMFNYCNNLTSLDLSKWDTSKVTDMGGMFSYCNKLTSLSSLRANSLSISSYASPFGTSNNTVLVDFGGFINLKSNWNGSYCVDKLTALSHQSLVNILNGLYDFIGNGVTPTSSQGKIKFGSTHLAKLSEEEKAIATNKGWTLS